MLNRALWQVIPRKHVFEQGLEAGQAVNDARSDLSDYLHPR